MAEIDWDYINEYVAEQKRLGQWRSDEEVEALMTASLKRILNTPKYSGAAK